MTANKTEKTIPTGEGLTFEKVWAMFKETDKKFQKTDKDLQELRKLQAENSRQMGGLHSSFGQLAEHLVAPGIEKRFNKLGYHFDAIATRGATIKDKKRNHLTEIDILLENEKITIAVEVKAKPAIQDIDHHIKRLEILRNYRRRINDKRKILGAIAGAIYDVKVKEAVSEAGFFVIEQSGDTMKIDMPKGFVPREW